MTGKADFTEQEWDLLRRAPADAGMIVITADKGGMLRETFAMAKAYAEARGQHGKSQLLDEIAAARPEREHEKVKSYEELKAHGLGTLRDAIALLESKATPEEVDDYRGFIRGLAERVASRHEEEDQKISPREQAAIDEISAALG
jgi:hypothetical protein